MQYQVRWIDAVALALCFWGSMAQTIWIDEQPGYQSLNSCAKHMVSAIVRGQVLGCGQKTSYSCFCSTSYATMNTKIAKAVQSDCGNAADANSAVRVFADYCNSTPMITIANAQTSTTVTSLTPPSDAATLTMPSSTTSVKSSSTTSTNRLTPTLAISSITTIAIPKTSSAITSPTTIDSATISSTSSNAPDSTPTDADNNQNTDKSKRPMLTAGGVAGVTVAAVVVAVLIVLAIVWKRVRDCYRKIRASRSADQSTTRVSQIAEQDKSKDRITSTLSPELALLPAPRNP